MSSLYNSAFDFGAIIHINQQSPSHYKDFWSSIIDTGAAVSACPMTFCEHMPSKPMAEETKKQFAMVTGEGLTIHGLKETTLITGTITIQVCFTVSNVQSPLIGLPDINDNNTTVHTGAKPYCTLSNLATVSNFYALEHISTWRAWCFRASTTLMKYDWTRRFTRGAVLHLQQLSLWVTLRN
eukprot:2210696-Amphidinium_carterae.1